MRRYTEQLSTFTNSMSQWEQDMSEAFEGMTEEDVHAHLTTRTYGDFELSDGITPSPKAAHPVEGYCIVEIQPDEREPSVTIPSIAISVTRSRIFDVFYALLDTLDESPATVLLEGFHQDDSYESSGTMQRVEDLDLPIIKHYLTNPDCIEMLTDDGCIGLGIADESMRMVHLTRDKIISVYAAEENQLIPAKKILEQHGIEYKPNMRLINEKLAFFRTKKHFLQSFDALAASIKNED